MRQRERGVLQSLVAPQQFDLLHVRRILVAGPHLGRAALARLVAHALALAFQLARVGDRRRIVAPRLFRADVFLVDRGEEVRVLDACRDGERLAQVIERTVHRARAAVHPRQQVVGVGDAAQVAAALADGHGLVQANPRAGLVSRLGGDLAQVDEHKSDHALVGGPAHDGQRLLQVPAGLIVLVREHVVVAQAIEHRDRADGVVDVPGQSPGFLQVGQFPVGIVVASAYQAQPGSRPELQGFVAQLFGQAQGGHEVAGGFHELALVPFRRALHEQEFTTHPFVPRLVGQRQPFVDRFHRPGVIVQETRGLGDLPPGGELIGAAVLLARAFERAPG